MRSETLLPALLALAACSSDGSGIPHLLRGKLSSSAMLSIRSIRISCRPLPYTLGTYTRLPLPSSDSMSGVVTHSPCGIDR